MPNTEPPLAQSHVGPVAVQRIMPGLQLAGGAADAVAALRLVERLHGGHVLVHRRGHLQPVLLEQILAVHQDEDRDVEGDADQRVLVGRDALHQGLGEVVPVEIRQRQIALAVVVLARIDRVAGEQRRPGLVHVVEVIGAQLALGVGRDLLQDLLERHDLDVDLDAGVGGELVLGQELGDHGGRGRLGDVADRRALVLAPDIAEPFRHVCRRTALRQRLRRGASRERPVPAQHGRREAGEPDPGHAEATKELTLADAPRREGAGAVRNIVLAVAVFHLEVLRFIGWRTIA